MTLRLVHLSDIHFGGEDRDATEAAVAAAHAFEPTLTIVSGDLTLNGLPREFAAARRWLDRLPTPLLVTPGNHDTPYWNIPLRAFTPFGRYRRYIGPADQSLFETPELAVYALNSARGGQLRLNWSLGALDLPTLERLTARFAANPKAAKIFVCHHPLIEVEGAPVEAGIRCGDEAARHLAAAGVDLILTGHLHTPFARPLPYAGGHSFCCGAGTLSIRTRGVPASYSTIEIDDATSHVAALTWTGSKFEPFRSWALPRRAAG
jgi:3',5'-cyclic AMP phosphodiesterase CpdA